MPFDIAQAISQLVGVVAGGAITFAGSHVGRRQQRQDALAGERRAREVAASGRAAETAAKLMALEDAFIGLMLDHQAHREDDVPKADRDALAREKDMLVRTFEIAVMDIGDRRVRDRLTGCATVWTVGALDAVTEHALRIAACEHAIDCIGAFRRGDSIPRPPDRLAEYMDRIEEAALHDHAAAMTARLRRRRDPE
jgi:hypothetical protein